MSILQAPRSSQPEALAMPDLSAADWGAVRAFFDAANAQSLPPLQWLAGQDMAANIRINVAQLLDSAHTTDGVLGRAAPVHAWAMANGLNPRGQPVGHERALAVGARLGAWEVTGLLGVGGMGEVYEARRTDGAYEGLAAVKVLKTAFGQHLSDSHSQNVLHRFAQEQQILASLNHPNIARLYDAGTTPATASQPAMPYFVMEKVDGQRIDYYVQGRPLAERLRVLLQLAQAVSHAHRNLAVHRDLKPSNVLVSASGEVKLLDFGIAKAIEPTAQATADLTRDDQRPLTPAYASPEQIKGEPITTGTDIYALGVLFYVLLTGRHPYKNEPTSAYEAMQALISQTFSKPSSIPAPSQRAGLANHTNTGQAKSGAADGADRTGGVGGVGASVERSIDPEWPRIRRALSLGLDWVVLKCLAKDPAERYASVDALIADVQNAQGGYPVSAQAPSAWLVLSKFVARNRYAVLAASVGAVALVGALAAAVWQGHQATLAQAQTAQRLQDVKNLTRSVIFQYISAVAYVPGGTEVRVKTLQELSAQLDAVVKSAPDDADLAADSALTHAHLADIYRPSFSSNWVDIAKARFHAQAAIALAERSKSARLDDSRAVAMHARAQVTLADIARVEGQLPAALAALESAERVLLAAPRAVQASSNWLTEMGTVQMATGRIKDSGDAAVSLNDTAGALTAFAKAEAAYKSAAKADEGAKQTLGNPDSFVANSMLGVVVGARGLLLMARDRFDEASLAFDASSAILETQLAQNPDETRIKINLATESNNAGFNHLSAGRWPQALVAMQRSHALLDALVAAEPNLVAHANRANTLKTHLGRALLANGDLPGAMQALSRAQAHLSQELVAKESAGVRRRLALTELALAQTHAAANRKPSARAAFEQSRDRIKVLVASDPKNRSAWVILADAHAGLAMLAAPNSSEEAGLQRQALAAFDAAQKLQPLGGQAHWRHLHAQMRVQALTAATAERP